MAKLPLLGPTSPELAAQYGGEYKIIGGQAYPVYGSNTPSAPPAAQPAEKLRYRVQTPPGTYVPDAATAGTEKLRYRVQAAPGTYVPEIPSSPSPSAPNHTQAKVFQPGEAQRYVHQPFIPNKQQQQKQLAPGQGITHQDQLAKQRELLEKGTNSSGILSKAAGLIEKLPGGDKLLSWGARAGPFLTKTLGPAVVAITGGWRAGQGYMNGDGSEVAKGAISIPAALAGGVLGAKIGAGVGLAISTVFPPAAVVVVPITTVVGSVAGAIGSVLLTDKAVDLAKSVFNSAKGFFGFGKKDTALASTPAQRDLLKDVDPATRKAIEDRLQENPSIIPVKTYIGNLAARDGVIAPDQEFAKTDSKGVRTADQRPEDDARKGVKPTLGEFGNKPDEAYKPAIAQYNSFSMGDRPSPAAAPAVLEGAGPKAETARTANASPAVDKKQQHYNQPTIS